MSEIKIEKGIKIPFSKRTSGIVNILDEMNISDSIFVEKSNASSIRQLVWLYGKKNNKKFTSRTVDGGFRIWRIK